MSNPSWLDLAIGRLVRSLGSPLTRRSALNFGAGFTVTDDPLNDQTTITTSGGGSGGTGALIVSTQNALKALTRAQLTNGQQATVTANNKAWIWSATTGANRAGDDRTLTQLTEGTTADAGRFYPVTAGVSVPNMTALRAASSGKTEFTTLQGFALAGDGGEGHFDWDDANTDDDDGGIVIRPSGLSTGAWVRRIAGHKISCKWFGAKGDGKYTTANTTNGNATVVLPGLTAANEGQLISISLVGASITNGFGTQNGPLYTSIVTVSGSNVTLADAPSRTLNGAQVFYCTDDATALNNWFAYAQAHFKTAAGLGVGVVGSGGLYTTDQLYMPFGLYGISDMVGLLMGDILCDKGTAVIGMDPTKDLIQCFGASHRLSGLLLAGGKSQILIMGADIGNPAIPTTITFRDLSMRHPWGPAIKQYTGDAPHQRAASMRLNVEHFDFEGACLYMGEFDGASFAHGFIAHQTRIETAPATPTYDDGVPLALWCFGDALKLDDVSIAPGVGASQDMATIDCIGACNLYVRDCRFGGEDALPLIRCWAFDDREYDSVRVNFDEGAANIQILGGPIASCGNKNWLEVRNGDFPVRIDVRAISPTTDSTINANVNIVNSFGVWVHDDVDLPTDRNRMACEIHLDGCVSPAFGAYRFRQGSTANRNNTIGVDLWPQLRQFFDTESVTHANQLYPGDDCPRDNLFVPNVWHIKSGVAGGADGASGGADVAEMAVDYSSGFPLYGIHTAGTGTQATRFYTKTLSLSTEDDWGDSLPEGEYVFSCYVKANWGGEVTFSRATGSQLIASRAFVASGQWQRLWFTFYHDGVGNDFKFQVSNIPDAGEFHIGLFAVHPGTAPARYTLPKGSDTAVATIVLPTDSGLANTGQQWVPRPRYAMALASIPPPGPHVVGEEIEVTDPQPGDFRYYVCCAGGVGTDAIWKGHSAIDTFDPATDLGSNLKMWLIGDTVVGGATVSTWTDQSGDGNSPTQASAGKRPTVNTAALNGHDTVTFDGVDDLLKKTFAGAISQPYTLYAAMKMASVGSGPTNHDIVFDGNTAASTFVQIDATETGIGAGGFLGDTHVVANGAWAVCEFEYNATNSEIRENGTVIKSGNAGGGSISGFTIGGIADESGNRWTNVEIAEILLVTNALEAAPFVRRYLQDKYGI